MALLPADRIIDWQIGVNVGVIGGIPTNRSNFINVTQAPYNADNTGVTDASGAINDAIAAVGATDGIYCPAGTYRLDSALVMNTSFNNKSFVGDGPDVTIFSANVSQAIVAGSASGYYIPPTPVVVTSGLTEGSTSIVCTGDITYLTGGNLIGLVIENDLSIPVVGVYNFNIGTSQAPQMQVVRVSSVSSQTINFSPPLNRDFSGLEVHVITQTFSATGIGLEDFTIDCDPHAGAYNCIGMYQCYGSWMKNIKAINPLNYGIIFNSCLLSEVRHCYAGELKGGGTNGAGFLFTAWNSLIEDNIFVESFPNVECNGGSAGNVFTYNYGDAMCNTNHSPHNRFNLHEGNAWNYMMSDGYFGSESDLLVYRCYLWGGSNNLRRFTRRYTMIGSINLTALGDNGYPNIGNTFSDGTAEYPSDPWRDFGMTGQLTTRTDATHGVVTVASGNLYYDAFVLHRFYAYWGASLENVVICNVTGGDGTACEFEVIAGTLPDLNTTFDSIGPGSFYTGDSHGSYQELDLAVAPDVIKKGNVYVTPDTTDPLGADPLVDSVVYDSKPANFGICPWPPYDWTNPGAASVENIPAGYRFTNGFDPPLSSDTQTGISGLAKISGTATIQNA